MQIKKAIYLALLAVILALIIMPFSFAEDNSTSLEIIENTTSDVDLSDDEIQSSDYEDLLSMDENQSDDGLSATSYADYYFDASKTSDGDGSLSNPYNTLNADRIKSNSRLHFAEGNYSFVSAASISHENVIILGHDSSKTIIKGSGVELTFSANSNINDITLSNIRIVNMGTLTASNTVFKDSVQKLNPKYYGGAINSADSKYSINLINCTFINNYATYGGAIYSKGLVNLADCYFINNTAYSYGGAIVSESSKSKLKIKNSTFINDRSINDAGGAIYIKDSTLTATNLNVTSCSSTFGGAIALLTSYVDLNSSYFSNNVAKYEGGAIYQIYGNLTVSNSIILNNTAKNGGGFFIDCSYLIKILNDTFENNSAILSGGAVYSLSNDYNFMENITYLNNSALVYDDLYDNLNITLTLISGDYTMYNYAMSNVNSLPSKYSSRTAGYVTSVKDQMTAGNCWAFAIIGTLESCILKASGDRLDLSEGNMKNVASQYSRFGWSMDTNEGGYEGMGVGYLTSWLGPVLERDDLYDVADYLSPILDSIMHVQNIAFLERTSTLSINNIKSAILNYGAVYSGIYMIASNYESLNAYGQCYRGSMPCDHAVILVGWDDTINIPDAPGKGAWIAKNSWGSGWGDGGYFYVSYYDTSCPKIGNPEAAFTFILNDNVKYDKNYQYDIAKTDYFLNKTSTVWYKNKFVASDDEYLAAVSTYFQKDTNWNIYVYVNNSLKLSKSGFSKAGYWTIDLGEFIPLSEGDNFEVVFKIRVSGDAGVPISESVSLNHCLYGENISYISYDGVKWKDLYELAWNYPDHVYDSQVACIKAFTVLNEINTTTSITINYNGFNPVEITVNVFNQYGKPVNAGNVILNLSGEIFTLKVSNGVVKLTHNFKRGLNNISAVFMAGGYNSSCDFAAIHITKYDVNMTYNITVDLNTAVVNVSISMPVNETVTLHLPDRNVSAKTLNGFASIHLDDLDYGFNNMTISLYDAIYETDDILTNYTITVKSTKILSNDLITVYKSGFNHIVKLTDKYGENLINFTLSYNLNGINYTKTTDANGEITIPVSLSNGVYALNVYFDGEDIYLKSSNSFRITVNPSIVISNTKFALNSYEYITYYSKSGSLLSSRQVSVVVGAKTYKLTTNKNGKASLKITFKPGTYSLKITNPETGEVTVKTIKVVKRITQNRNVNMYYGAGMNYKVRVCDDYGNYKNGIKVTFKINGKSYSRTSDKNGYVLFKISQKPGKYTITATYKGFKVSNKVNVKSTIVTKNKSFKKGKTIKFTAKLLNSKGKILKNKKITFKFKGKFYNVKTNKNGIAILKITKKYKVGKYTITSSYGKLKVQNKIIIKK